MTQGGRGRDELDREEPTVLSEREAMSIIAQGPGTEFAADSDAVPDDEESPSADENDPPEAG